MQPCRILDYSRSSCKVTDCSNFDKIPINSKRSFIQWAYRGSWNVLFRALCVLVIEDGTPFWIDFYSIWVSSVIVQDLYNLLSFESQRVRSEWIGRITGASSSEQKEHQWRAGSSICSVCQHAPAHRTLLSLWLWVCSRHWSKIKNS